MKSELSLCVTMLFTGDSCCWSTWGCVVAFYGEPGTPGCMMFAKLIHWSRRWLRFYVELGVVPGTGAPRRCGGFVRTSIGGLRCRVEDDCEPRAYAFRCCCGCVLPTLGWMMWMARWFEVFWIFVSSDCTFLWPEEAGTLASCALFMCFTWVS